MQLKQQRISFKLTTHLTSKVNELNPEKELIKALVVQIRFYNYSYIQNQLIKKYKFKASLPTINNNRQGKKTVSTYQDPAKMCMIMR